MTSSSAERIRVLSESVVSGIAAGEVAERPAAIVKELIENAMDAGARRIEIDFDDDAGGRIVVTDDGHGIHGEDLRLAVTPHATSKLRELDDLRRVRSFGFRGEALASIGAVSRLELVSRPGGTDAGARIQVKDGQVLEVTSAGTRPGTRVTISELFESVPARRKFLKTPAAEYSLAAETVRRFALVHPATHVRVSRNGKLSFDLPPVADLKTRIRQVLGRDLGATMVELHTRYAGMEIGGALSPAGVSFGTPRRVSLFVNDRLVHDRLLFRAVIDGYRTYLLNGRFPAVVLFLSIDPARVDVNVHPAKTEVRFAEPEQVQRFVAESLRDTLRGAASPLGRWGLGEDDLLRARARGESMRAAVVASPPQADEAVADGAPPGYVPGPRLLTPQLAQHPVQLALAPAVAGDGVKVLGQIFRGYIVCQAGDELVLVDQHAAHERILFERLKTAYAGGAVESQRLLTPATVAVGDVGVERVGGSSAELARLGWEIEPFGDEEVAVRAVPALAVGADVHGLVERLIADLVRTDPRQAGDAAAERILATVACHAAIRAGDDLDAPAMRDLLRQVSTADFAASCPHGRPVARVMSRPQLERWFGR